MTALKISLRGKEGGGGKEGEMIKAFPKIFAVGTDYINNIFEDDVEITEKIDGSQFVFGRIDGELYMRSKGKQLILDAPEKMFSVAVNYVLSIQDFVADNTVYYCEYLNKPRHNILNYGRTPINNIILFGISKRTTKFISNYSDLKREAELLNIETVPALFTGKIKTSEELLTFLDIDSILGNTKIEGVVVKNYAKPFLLGGQPIPLMAGKYVSEKFKEKHKTNWGKEYTSKGKWQTFIEGYRSDARWHKAIQHLRDNGELENAPKDIGKLIVEIKRDIAEEEKEIIKNFLWKEYSQEVMRKATAGFPEWYKEHLLKQSFEVNP